MLHRCVCSLMLVTAVAVVGCSGSTPASKPNTAATAAGQAPPKGAGAAPVEKVGELPPRK
jgi:hypothetical protein